MKIKFTCDLGDVRSNTWSGTTKAVFERMSKKNIECIPTEYKVKKKKNRLFTLLESVYMKLFFYWDKNIIGYDKEWIEFLSEELEDCDGMFFFSSFVIGAEKFPEKTFYLYIDCELNYEQKYLRRRMLPLRRWFLNHYNTNVQKTLQNTAIVFTMNEWTAREIINTYHYPAERVVNVGFGVNCKFLSGEKDYNSNLLLIVLRKGTERYKGLYMLLEAFKLVYAENPNVRLAVVGTNVGHNIPGVKCYYGQPRQTTLQLFEESALYVMPSLCEPNGITYLEALANKTPIIGLNRFALPEFTGYGKYGFIVERESAMSLAKTIIDALSDKSRLRQMGENGQEFVKSRYSWNKVVDIICRNMQ